MLPRFRIRTLMIAVASAAIGFATAPRRQFAGYMSYMDSHHNQPIYYEFSIFESVAMAVVIGALTFASVTGILAILPRLTLRQRIVAVGVMSLLLTAEVTRERWTDRAVYSRERADQLNEMIEFLEANAANHHAAGADRDADWCRTRAAQLRLLWISYDRAARHPWLPIPPDPP